MRSGPAPIASLVALAAAGTFAAAAQAQVIQIGPSGDLAVFDHPAVFDRTGASPIVLRRERPVKGPRTPVADITSAAQASELSPALVEAVARQESGLRARVVSRAGAIGEMQLMPATARALGVDASVTRDNYRGGAAYLRLLMKRYDGDVVRALAAYNAGPGAVDRHGGTPPYRETQAYVAAVLERLSRAAEEGGAK